MLAHNSYDYALIRVAPSVERGECINVGVILFCRTGDFLDCSMHLDAQRLAAFAPQLDLDELRIHLDEIARICKGGKDAGSLGQLSPSERFHWLVSPRSTIIQPSPVHSGLCNDPRETLHHLLKTMVL